MSKKMRLMFTKLIITMIVMILFTGFASNGYTQTIMSSDKGKTIFQSGKKPGIDLKSLSLLDPERFSMKNQYMMSFSSVGGSGSMMGMYINTMEYRF